MANAELICFEAQCRTRYAIDEVLYNCPKCGGLLEVTYGAPDKEPDELKRIWRQRRCDNSAIEQSGVWRYREMIDFVDDTRHVVTLREGNTPLLQGPRAAAYGGLDRITFKHQGFNPTGSFKDNGMTCGATQAMRLGMKRVACVSTGNTSASMAAYASAAGLQPIIFLPHGNISYGKLAQALEYGALTLQVEANFDQILKLVRVLSERLGIYLLNSINPFRIEGQKIDRDRDDGPARLESAGLDRVAGRQSGQCVGVRKSSSRVAWWRFHLDRCRDSPWFKPRSRRRFTTTCGQRIANSTRLKSRKHSLPRYASAILCPGRKPSTRSGRRTVSSRMATEQEIADAKAIVGQCGIGCEPASAATLAGIRKLTAAGIIDRTADVVAVLTGNVLKDPDYIYRYHTSALKAPDGTAILPGFANKPVIVPNDENKIAGLLIGIAIRRAIRQRERDTPPSPAACRSHPRR